MLGEWKPPLVSDYQGTKYSFRKHLGDGHRCYRLRALGDNRNDEDYYLAPDEARPIFLRVLLDCLESEPGQVGAWSANKPNLLGN
jgi:hypothetical protein